MWEHSLSYMVPSPRSYPWPISAWHLPPLAFVQNLSCIPRSKDYFGPFRSCIRLEEINGAGFFDWLPTQPKSCVVQYYPNQSPLSAWNSHSVAHCGKRKPRYVAPPTLLKVWRKPKAPTGKLARP